MKNKEQKHLTRQTTDNTHKFLIKSVFSVALSKKFFYPSKHVVVKFKIELHTAKFYNVISRCKSSTTSYRND